VRCVRVCAHGRRLTHTAVSSMPVLLSTQSHTAVSGSPGGSLGTGWLIFLMVVNVWSELVGSPPARVPFSSTFRSTPRSLRHYFEMYEPPQPDSPWLAKMRSVCRVLLPPLRSIRNTGRLHLADEKFDLRCRNLAGRGWHLSLSRTLTLSPPDAKTGKTIPARYTHCRL
jgi:hypothetical protein